MKTGKKKERQIYPSYSSLQQFIVKKLNRWVYTISNHSLISVKGFTLIEILVTITIIITFTSLSYAGYSFFDKRQKLTVSGQNLKNLFRDAQSRAFNYEVDCGICDCSLNTDQILRGWFVDFGTRTSYGECKDSLGANQVINQVSFNTVDEVNITPYITPNVTPAAVVFYFSPPSANQQATICLSSKNLANSYYVIRVYKSGLISDDGGLVSTCTP